jgi:hypothetical protein
MIWRGGLPRLMYTASRWPSERRVLDSEMSDDLVGAVEVASEGVTSVDVVSHVGSQQGDGIGRSPVNQGRLQKALCGGQVRGSLHPLRLRFGRSG